MILLDTDHLSVFTDERDARHGWLIGRLEATAESIGCTIVSIEELLRGWLAVIHRSRDVHRQLSAYGRLGRMFDVFREWEIAPFEKPAADRFVNLRRQGIRIGAMDFKIAAITLANDATFLTTNNRDFGQVPGLRFKNWLIS